ncbi:MAG TPA: amidohydrolase family protein [Opitutaceae bacterium]|jgi:imidazolonepropionase-like amidohydrolase
MNTPSARLAIGLLAATGLVATLRAADPERPLVSVRAPIIALTHVRVFDATSAEARENQTLVFDHGRIAQVGSAADISVPAGATTIDATGKTVIPGLVMVHEHLYYAVRVRNLGFHVNEMEYSFPRLYLACGLTTIRTGGSVEPYADMEVKRRIDAGEMPGPKIHLTAPYVEGPPSSITQLHAVSGPEDAIRLIDYWATQGFTSVKLYVHLTPAVAGPAIAEAHRLGMQVTGHIGAMTYREAADLGIDNLEHGFFVANDFVRGKKENELPLPAVSQASIDQLKLDAPELKALYQHLIEKHVAITSTLAVFEGFVGGRPELSPPVLATMSEPARVNYETYRAHINSLKSDLTPWFHKEMAMEKGFADAGGLVVVGTDPTGGGNVVAGFGSLRAVELLVEAGFTPAQALTIATRNGAKLLGVDHEVGTLETGKAADAILINGNPLKSIGDIRKIETVFKDGVGYDSRTLINSTRGCVGVE